MRRKSERTATKKAKPSPEKKVEKVKRTRRGRRKQSSSSDNESADDGSPARVIETTAEVEVKPPQTPVKEDSLEEAQDQVWRVKAAGGSGDGGEIQKIKICLTRPPSTPERVDRSPRSKRKHSRATSSSDTPSNEGVDDKKKTKHRSRKTTRESKDDKGVDSHGEDVETEPDIPQDDEKSNNEVTQSDSTSEKDSKEAQPPAETPMSTTNEEVKENESENVTVSTEEDSQKKECKEPDSQKKECKEPDSQKKECKDTDSQKNECKEPDSQKNESKEPDTQNNECQEPDSQKPSDADTTVVSPKDETTVASPTIETPIATAVAERKSPERKRSLSVDKSEILEIHADESKCESSDNEAAKPKEDTKDEPTAPEETSSEKKVSKIEDIVSKESEIVNNESNKTDVVESSKNNDTEAPKTSTEDEVMEKENIPNENEIVIDKPKQLECSDSTVSKQDVSVPNGQATPAPTRKRRWGSRPTKLTTQKSITISTDVLKDIIPDVKPVEFEEVIEEKKHKKIEKYDKVERPILPKIVIDNTENVERHKYEGKERDRDVKPRETHLAVNRKISIVKDNDSIIARPPSPPRNKQSCILYITNLVRPFTLPQLKNLLQRTGKIEENGFWIDRIKSKCFVKYETDDQAVETRHALHGVTWPVSNPKTLQVDFSTQEAFDKAKLNEETDGAPVSTIPGTVEDWLREQDQKRERGELEKPWERKASTREWDLGKNEKDKDKDKVRRDERPMDKRRHRSPEKSPEPAKKFKKKEEEAPAKLLDDLFRKTKTTPCIYWLPLSAETIAVKEEQRRQHMAEHERRLQELRRTHRRH